MSKRLLPLPFFTLILFFFLAKFVTYSSSLPLSSFEQMTEGQQKDKGAKTLFWVADVSGGREWKVCKWEGKKCTTSFLFSQGTADAVDPIFFSSFSENGFYRGWRGILIIWRKWGQLFWQRVKLDLLPSSSSVNLLVADGSQQHKCWFALLFLWPKSVAFVPIVILYQVGKLADYFLSLLFRSEKSSAAIKLPANFAALQML